MLVGILADSHGDVAMLRRGIEALKRRDAGMLIHLGDVADTLKLDSVDECVELLIRNEISGVMGNHEYSLVMHHFKRYPDRFSEATKNYVRSLPQRLEMLGVCFTHFSPDGGAYGLFAPTDDKNYEGTLRSSAWPVLVNGHSHEPRIYRQLDGTVRRAEFEVSVPFELEEGARYVLTCGALEDRYCALYDSEARSFEVALLPN